MTIKLIIMSIILLGIAFAGIAVKMFFIKEGRKDTAADDSGTNDDRKNSSANNDIRKPRPVVHNHPAPGSDEPGQLTDNIARRLQTCALMIIGGHFIAERDPGDGKTGESDEIENLEY